MEKGVKVMCNGMLGTLAKWLRIYGVDAAYYGCNGGDEELMSRAANEGRVIITRDRELFLRCGKAGLRAIYMPTTDLQEQLDRAVQELGVDGSRALTRCIICNVELDAVGKEDVKGRVPERVYHTYDEFYLCRVCGRIYWPGTHYRNMEERIRGVV